MGEVIRVNFSTQPEFQKISIRPDSVGALALAGPPQEPPFGPPKRRHLSSVKPLADEVTDDQVDSKDTHVGNPVSYDLDRRRILRESKPKTEKVMQPKTEPALSYYAPSLPRRESVQVYTPVVSHDAPEKQVVFSAPKKEKPEKQMTMKESLQEYFYSKEWVEQEVEKVKRQPLIAGESPWWEGKGTGFWVKEQIGTLVKNLQGVGSEAFPNVLELELSKVSVDFEHFEREYEMQRASLDWHLALENRDGVMRVVCPEYKGAGKDKNGSLWSSVTSKDEREGIVFQTLFGTDKEAETGAGGVEGWIKKAKPGSVAFIISPGGWSGYEGATYGEAQAYGIQMLSDGSLKAHTFRYDATIEQIEGLQRMMGLTIPKATNNREQIKNTIANVALLTPEDAKRLQITGFEDFVTMMQQSVGGRDVAYGKGRGIGTFDEIRAYLKNPDSFVKNHQITEKLNNRFAEYARWLLAQEGSWEDKTLKLTIAKGLDSMHLGKVYSLEEAAKKRGGSGGDNGSTVYFSGSRAGEPTIEDALIYQVRNGNFNYDLQKKEQEKKPGCAGGGPKKDGDGRYSLNSKYIVSMGAPREVKTDTNDGYSGEDYSGENAVNDPNLCRCGQNDGPHFHCPSGGCGHAITVGEGITACPSCGAGKAC